MFEYFVGVMYGFALLSDHFVVFLCAHLSLYRGPFVLARVVYLDRGFLDTGCDIIVLVEGWEAVEY